MERELTARFYKHTAVALHDWQTYSQLAALARERLSLEVEIPDLPGLVVDPGVCLTSYLLRSLHCELSLEVPTLLTAREQDFEILIKNLAEQVSSDPPLQSCAASSMDIHSARSPTLIHVLEFKATRTLMIALSTSR